MYARQVQGASDVGKKGKHHVNEVAMKKQYRVPLSVAAIRYAKGLSPKGHASRAEKPVARKIVLGIMSLFVLIAMIGCSRDDRVAESTQEEDAEAAARFFSAMLLQAQQEQAQRDRWNQLQAEKNSRYWRELEQRQARERQIRQEEYIRQAAREEYQRADPVGRSIMRHSGY